MAKTYQEVLSWASSFLEEQGKEGYAIQYVFLARKHWTKTDWLLNMRKEISFAEEQQLQSDLAALLANHPPQYLIGYEEFYGRRFQVTTDTLIPRPETEELVALCLEKNSSEPLTVVDVGTGTGAIAITLKAERPNWQVMAVDISVSALEIAQKNSQALTTEVDFYLGDTLEPISQPIDVLISNPPYISQAEWSLMDESVRLFEPKTALFASNNGLAMYEKLAQQAKMKLQPHGKIFLEIGFQQGEAVKKLFQEVFPDKVIEIKKDLAGQDRMVFVS
jgi:release factor glutamine methyltransferase